MKSNAWFTAARSLPVLLVTLMLGCGGDLALPTSSGTGVELSILGGNGQTGTVGQALPEPLVVGVRSNGTPIEGHRVAFVVAGDPAAGRLDPDTAVTGADGRAIAHWVLGSEPGSHEVEARLVVTEPAPPPSATFEASAVAGEPDTLRAVSPLSQPGRMGQPTRDAPTILVVDRFGNAVGGAQVTWTVTAGAGTVDRDLTLTDADGRAAVVWSLGLRVGVHKLMARVDGAHGSPVTFTASVLF